MESIRFFMFQSDCMKFNFFGSKSSSGKKKAGKWDKKPSRLQQQKRSKKYRRTQEEKRSSAFYPKHTTKKCIKIYNANKSFA